MVRSQVTTGILLVGIVLGLLSIQAPPLAAQADTWPTSCPRMVATSPTGRTPKLIWTPARQATWSCMVSQNHVWWQRLKTLAEAGTSAEHAAIAYQMTGDNRYAQISWNIANTKLDATSWNTIIGDHQGGALNRYVIVYDFLYPFLTADQRSRFIDRLNAWGDIALTGGRIDKDQPRGATGAYMGVALIDLATAPENPRAGTFLNQTWNDLGISKPIGGLTATASDYSTLRNTMRKYADLANGSTWITSFDYSEDLKHLLTFVEAVKTVKGTDYFPELTSSYAKMARDQIYMLTPDGQDSFQWANVERIRGLRREERVPLVGVLAGLLQTNPSIGPQIKKLAEELAHSTLENNSGTRPSYNFFLFYNPYAPETDWRSSFGKSYSAPGQGITYYHHGWNASDSFFMAQMAPNDTKPYTGIHHHGNYKLYRKGEWVIDHPVAYHTHPYPAHNGETTNSMTFAGLSSVAEAKGPIAEEIGSINGQEYVYSAGSTGGQYFPPGYFAPPPQFMHEWTRSLVYLSSLDKKSETVVVFDRTHIERPQQLDRYTPGDINEQGLIATALSKYGLKQWFIHSPVEPTVNGQRITWQTSGGQRVQVDSLLPAQTTKRVIDESNLDRSNPAQLKPQSQWLWPQPPTMPIKDGHDGHFERQWQTRIIPQTEQPRDTFLNVVQAYDAGFTPNNTLVKSSGGEAEGVLVKRSGHNDTILLFSARQADVPPTPPQNSRAVHNPAKLAQLAQARLHTTGFAIDLPLTSASTTVLLFDLTPTKTWHYRVGNGAATPVSVSSQGVAQLTLTGSETQTVTLVPSDTALVKVTKSVDRETATTGGTLTYTIMYENQGDKTATEVMLTDTIPQNTSYVANTATGGATLSEGQIRWNLGSLPPGEKNEVQFQVIVSAP